MGLVIKSMKKESTTRQCPLERHSVSEWVMDRLLKARGDSFGFEQEPIPERSTWSLRVSGRKNIYNPLDLILVSAVTHSKTESPRSLCSRSILHEWTKPSVVLFRGSADACMRSSLSTKIHKIWNLHSSWQIKWRSFSKVSETMSVGGWGFVVIGRSRAPSTFSAASAARTLKTRKGVTLFTRWTPMRERKRTRLFFRGKGEKTTAKKKKRKKTPNKWK